MLHDLWDFVTGGMMSWYEAKMFVEHASLFSSDALHVIVGVLVWIVLAVALRRRLTDWQPLLGLAVLLILNEATDLWVERWPDPAMQFGEAAKDVLLTVALPILLMIVARVQPDLFSRGRRR